MKLRQIVKRTAIIVAPVATLIVGLLIGLSINASSPQATAVKQAPVSEIADLNELLKITNKDRLANGLAPLARNNSLDHSALDKCNDMVTKNYWAHDAPDGTTPWHFIADNGISYLNAGENLFYSTSPTGYAEIEKDWMASPEHRSNILNSSYTSIGFGYCHSDKYVSYGSSNIVVEHLVEIKD